MSRAARLQHIEELLLSAHDGFSTVELAEMLNVHRTTIWRDLNELSHYAPVQQIEDRYFIDRSDYLSSVRLSRGESLMLYLALRRIIRDSSYAPPMMIRALEKLTLALRNPSKSQLAATLEAIHARPPVSPEQAQVWETLVQALLERITVQITYQELESSEVTTHEVQPHLFEPAVVGEGVYLIGHSLTHGELRAFKAEHITRAVLTTDRFVRPDRLR
jgi:predicted DNA-binding transcriptional regulator YafY